ncbi:hypothetical protein KEM54_005901, partial [Ascosphaera aggregata]
PSQLSARSSTAEPSTAPQRRDCWGKRPPSHPHRGKRIRDDGQEQRLSDKQTTKLRLVEGWYASQTSKTTTDTNPATASTGTARTKF